jgi:hypothetical protein
MAIAYEELQARLRAVARPERANEWAQGLARAISGLTGFPGPLSHARNWPTLRISQ